MACQRRQRTCFYDYFIALSILYLRTKNQLLHFKSPKISALIINKNNSKKSGSKKTGHIINAKTPVNKLHYASPERKQVISSELDFDLKYLFELISDGSIVEAYLDKKNVLQKKW